MKHEAGELLMICKNCGTNCHEGANYCPECGNKIESAGKTCPNSDCRKSGLPPEALYCPDCGSELNQGSSEHKPSQQAPQPKNNSDSRLEAAITSNETSQGGNLYTWVTVVMAVLLAGVFFFINPFSPALYRNDLPNYAEYLKIPAGEFMMGSPAGELERSENETMHRVRMSSFYLGKYEVTVGEFQKFVDATGFKTYAERVGNNKTWQNPGISQQSNHPVVCVSWNDAVAYCKWLSEKTGKTYRLPTEAEWEYACRAGTTTPFNTGTNLTTEQANYDGNSPYNGNAKGVYRATTVPVDSFAPNAWGLYNMHGNVWEWCSDWYGGYPSGTVDNPAGPSTGSSRVIRGGGWNGDARYCRSAIRIIDTPDYRGSGVGFRLVFVP